MRSGKKLSDSHKMAREALLQGENINTSGNLLPDVFIEGDFKRDIKKYFLFYYSIYQARENFRLYRRDYSAYSILPCQDMIPPIFFTF